MLQLPDGRQLAWAAHGSPVAKPVLFVAGAATGKSMTFAETLLEQGRMRLITLDRPGMGQSTPDPRRSLTSTAQDIAHLIRHSCGEPVLVVANSQGAPFALALAATGAAAQLVLVSPADEVAVEPIRSMLPEPQQAVVEQVNTDPIGARRFLAGLGPEGMQRLVLEGADQRDRAVYEEPAFLARYRAALAEGFANSGAGYATDTVLAMQPWNLDLQSLRCRVDIWVGDRDHTHSPDQGATLASRIRGARRSVVSGGGSLLWTSGAAILTDWAAPGSMPPPE
ncbi:alpha/beta fold hydrolase [Lysobacter korlensis]|uniref:Alpha/beta fold hydrolase n=1 Tax=Lysobacter korlensis TaxID=553636 RepID=A0ABV6S077_9GAMM